MTTELHRLNFRSEAARSRSASCESRELLFDFGDDAALLGERRKLHRNLPHVPEGGALSLVVPLT